MSACPRCGGSVIVVLLRAWCMRAYTAGGCGSFFTSSNGRWRRVVVGVSWFGW